MGFTEKYLALRGGNVGKTTTQSAQTTTTQPKQTTQATAQSTTKQSAPAQQKSTQATQAGNDFTAKYLAAKSAGQATAPAASVPTFTPALPTTPAAPAQQQTVAQRIGNAAETVGKGASDFLSSVISGGDVAWGGLFGALSAVDEATANAANSVKKFITGDKSESEPFVSPFREYAQYHNEKAAETLGEATEGRGKVGQKVMSTGQAIGNMLAMSSLGALGQGTGAGIGATFGTSEAALGAGAAQKGLTAVSNAAARLGNEILTHGTNAAISIGSGGQTYLKAVNSGAEQGKALQNAILAGLIEYESNKMFSGTPLEDTGEKGYVTKLIEYTADKLGKSEALASFLNSAVGKGASIALDKIGEGLEEVIAEIGDPIAERITWNPQADLATIDEIVDAFEGGILLSTMMSGGEAVIDNAVKIAQRAQGNATPAPVNAGARQTSAEGNLTPAANGTNLDAKNGLQNVQAKTPANAAPAAQQAANITPQGVETAKGFDAQQTTPYNWSGGLSAQAQNAINRVKAGEALTVEEMLAIPEIEEAERQSNAEPTINLPNREQVRQSGIDAARKLGSYSGKDAKGNDLFNGKVRQEHRMDIVLGLPGSGKSSIYSNPLSQKYGERIIDTDDFRAYIPEYNGLNSAAVDQEASLIKNAIFDEALSRGDNILLSMVGDNYEKTLRKIERYEELGYEVHLHLNELPNSKSLGRSVTRYLTDEAHRYVPVAYVAGIGDAPTQTFLRLIGQEGRYGQIETDRGGAQVSRGAGVGGSERTGNAGSPDSGKARARIASYDWYNNDVEKGRPARLILSSAQEFTTRDGNNGDHGNATGAAQAGFNVPHGEQVPTQNRTVTDSTYLTDEEAAEMQPQPHERISEGQSIERARQQFYADENGNVTHLDDTIRALLEKETWLGEDQDAAHLAMQQLIERSRAERANGGEVSEETARQIQDLARAIEHIGGTLAGQSLQARQKWVNTPSDIITRAEHILENAREHTNTQEVLDTITDLALDFDDAMDAESWDDVADVIRRTSRLRRTGSFFTNQWSRTMENALDHVVEQAADGDESAREFLENHAANGLVAIAQDYAPVTRANALLTIRRNAMLSKLNTTMRNLVSNNVFDPIDSVSRNLSVPIDVLLSRATGTRSVAGDASWFSAAKRRGSIDGLERSILEVGLDVDATGERGRYENGAQRTFSMNGGTVSRLLSTWEKHLGYRLYSTDQFQKGGIDAEIQRGLDELYERGLITDETLRNGGATEALYRTFQDETQLSKLSINARRALNSVQYNGHDLHLGDIAIPFAQVPANLGTRALEYSPVGLANGIFQLGHVLTAARNGNLTAAQQARAVQSIGRGMNGTALIACATALALKGILHVADVGGDEDKDKKALERQSGVNGTQINLSALARWERGESTEWRDGDVLHTIGYLDPLNAQLTTGALIAQDYANDDGTPSELLKDTLEGTIQSVLDIPVMSTLKDTADAYHYSTSGTEGGKLIDAGMSLLSGQVASIIPNSIKGIAQGTDRYQRDQYSEKSVAGQTWDAIRASFPGAREELPAKLDSYGRPLENSDMLLNFINSNVSPGAYNRYRRPQQEVTQELDRLNGKTGDNGVYPSRAAPNAVTNDGVKIELSKTEKRDFQRTAGREFLDFANAIIGGEMYDELTDKQKADALSSAVVYANAKARQDVIEAHGGEYTLSGEAHTVEKAIEAGDAGIDPSEYFVLKAVHDEINSDTSLTAAEKATKFASYLNSTPWLDDAGRARAQELLTYSSGFRAEANDKALAAEESGIPLDVWNEYHRATSAMTADKDANGKTIAGSKKAKVVEYINGMDISADQKDQLYLDAGYAAKDLGKTPWHE